jgi:hypothetical protein
MQADSILIRFIRKDSNKDDTVKINRVGTNQYRLGYTYGDSKKKNEPTYVELNGSDVFRWMRFVIGLLEKDNDPFESVQLDWSFMPSVMFNIDTLGSVYHSLLDALEFYLDHPTPSLQEKEEEQEEDYDYTPNEYNTYDHDYRPTSPISPVPSSNSRRHIFFDDDGYMNETY